MSKRSFLLAVTALLAISQTAVASPSTKPTVDIQLFHPVADATGFVTTDSGEVNSPWGLNLGLNINYANKPLAVTLKRTDGTLEYIGAIVGYRVDADLVAAMGFFDIAELGLSLPFTTQGGFQADQFQAAQPPIDVGLNTSSGSTAKLQTFTQGNLRLIPKVRLLNIEDGKLALAFVGTIVVPTAGNAYYATEAGAVYQGALAGSTRLGHFRAALDFGYKYRPTTTVVISQGTQPLLTVHNELYASLAAAYNFGTREKPFEIVGEAYGLTPAKSFSFSMDQKPRTTAEADLSLRIGIKNGWVLTIGGGGGILPGYGAPAPRIFAGIGYYMGYFGPPDRDHDGIPDAIDKCPDKPEDFDGFQDEDGCPDLDNDGDGVLDEDDLCPNEPEDIDGFEDEDGCPDIDNDWDGIPDALDKCPNQPEDKDGFQDADGCPDPDNDADGIPDALDKCPNEAEDIDGYQDEDGCPDIDNDWDGLPDLNDLCPNSPEDKDGFQDDDGCPDDNDGDGIADDLDKCPNQPENYNGFEDEDGCPDNPRIKSLVAVTKEKIEIKDKIFFDVDKATIQKKSFDLLNQVASVLKNYKYITKIRIEGHTDSQGQKAHNMKLSQDRAESVRAYLVEHGIDIKRLDAQGFGPDRPISSNKTAKGKEMNRRVEFVIVEQKAIGGDVSEGQKAAAPPAGAEPTFEIPGAAPAPGATPAPAPAPAEGGFDLGITPDKGGGTPAPAPAPAEEPQKGKKKKKKKVKEDDVQFNF